MTDPKPDILIIGAGPTGLTLALELCLQSQPISTAAAPLTFRIIDALPSPSPYSRALALQPRSLELLAKHGVAAKLIEKGRFNDVVRIFVAKKFVYEIDVKDIAGGDSKFKTPLMISQAEIEGVLEERLGEYGGMVERGLRVGKLEEDSSGVIVFLKNQKGEEERVRARYVIGCDGAHSVARKEAGLSFEGGTYKQDFILADVRLEWEGRMCMSLFMSTWGTLLIFPLPSGIARLIAMRTQKAGSDTEPTIEDFEEAFHNLVPFESKLKDPIWITKFNLHHRLASSFRSPSGNIFLAGDAAHIHSPAGGQGMNTGIQDSVNLGWKLAFALRAQRGEEQRGAPLSPSSSLPNANLTSKVLLGSYNIERRRIGENLLKGTDRIFEMMATRSWVWLWLRNWLMPWILPLAFSSRARRANRFRFVSQLGIRYRQSPIAGMARGYMGGLRGGDRAPDGRLGRRNPGDGEGEQEIWVHDLMAGPGFYLLLFFGREGRGGRWEELEKAVKGLLDENDGWVKVHYVTSVDGDGSEGQEEGIWDPEGKVHSVYGFQEPGYVLVRPDGYIAHIGPVTPEALGEMGGWAKSILPFRTMNPP